VQCYHSELEPFHLPRARGEPSGEARAEEVHGEGRSWPWAFSFLERPPGRNAAEGTTSRARSNFFQEKRAAAVLKHGILRRYVFPFANKTGRWSPEHRVFFLDGYAGPGVYDDGTPGSPALVVQTAEAMASRDLRGVFVERNRPSYEKLCRLLDGKPGMVPVLGTIEENLEDILRTAEGCPLFAFFDPFGLGISFDLLTEKILTRSRKVNGVRTGHVTEVLLNFSLPGLRRNAGHLASGSQKAHYQKARQALVARVDSYLGGEWWREIWESGAADREAQILRGYVTRLKDSGGGWGYYYIPVAQYPGGPPVYDLIFLTQHPDGLWLYHEAVSNAAEEYRRIIGPVGGGQLSFFEVDQDSEWASEIRQNIEAHLGKAGPYRIKDRMREVFGATLGEAREKHVRAALKELYEERIIGTNPRGQSIPEFVVAKAGS
jgi:three-Cys-motif partner protein